MDRQLARTLLAGEPLVDDIVDRATRAFGKRWRWIRPLARRYVAQFGQTRPRLREVVEFLYRDAAAGFAWLRRLHELPEAPYLTTPPRMHPVPAARPWNLPTLETTADLAHFLNLTDSELSWFADLKGFGQRYDRPKCQHYRYRVLLKHSGAIRLIESPKQRMKQLQRQILTHILDKIPVHPAAHGFRKARSIRTFVAPHVGRSVVIRMDLQDFFPNFSRAQIQAFFRTAGYPEPVADLLGGICTNRAPRSVCKTPEARELYSYPHLPQGAPTSPALANLCAYRIDCRLAGLAESAGAAYTRYADDLAFSGDDDFARRAERFSIHVAAILHEEGFSVHHRKTRIMRQGVRQHLAGLITNQHANTYRADFDRLKAILTNCVRLGPDSQNRDAHPAFRAHLEGRIAFVESVNPARGRKLRAIFERIRW